jgi:plasmid maintenance system antidote protein VapI
MGQLAHMDTSNKPAPISDLLRRTVAEAIEQGRTNYLTIERETGVQRASIRRFVTGERTLRLDVADQLAAYFGLELRPGKGKRATARTKKG